ncbi:MAG: hypothetical protein QXW97_03745 [Candidatus Pacearchaeota archaeon]
MVIKKSKKKEIKIKYKTFFLIANLIIAIFSFGYLIGSVNAQCYGGSCSTTPNPNQASAGINNLNLISGGCAGGSCNIGGGTITPGEATQPGNAPGGSINTGPSIGNIGNGNIENPPNPGAEPGQTYEELIGQGGTNPFAGPGSQGGRVGGTGPGVNNEIPNYPIGGGGIPPGGGGIIGTTGNVLQNYFSNFFEKYLWQLGAGAGIGATIGGLAGGKQGIMWGTISAVSGVFTYQILNEFGLSKLTSGLAGIGVFLIIFLLTYKKEQKEYVEFNCLPWQSPLGGEDCEKCNKYAECSEYTCKSLGQACELINKGTKDQKCVWKNPYDTNSPIIEMKNVSAGHKFFPDNTIRPPATGVKIIYPPGKGQCIKAFTPLEFTFITNEPAQCKIDYNLTTDSKLAYEQMNFYVGGTPIFSYNHTEKLALPGPDAINKLDPTIKNDGTYTLYIRCIDANGNFNQNPFAVRFCVEKGPDETPPLIVNVSIPSKMPVQFNISKLDLEVYVNEPAECRWSRENRDFNLMEGNMSCSQELWEMNNENTYTCRTTLTGIESRKENLYFFRCKDKPGYEDSERNVNKESYSYVVIGTQPLNIIEFGPNGTIYGATESIPVTLFVRTDNGYSNGEAICYYSTTENEKDYIEFSNTSTINKYVNYHTQRQDLLTKDYTYYFKCVDKGGNAAYNVTRFRVETDLIPPHIIRIYKESGELIVITNENAECSYSHINCNFEIDNGIKMTSLDYLKHNTEWKSDKYYFIRCKDRYNNQPNPNVCSLTLRPFEYSTEIKAEGSIEL